MVNMKKILTATAFMAMVAAGNPAFATAGGEPNNTNCNGRGNPNSPCTGNPGGPPTATPPVRVRNTVHNRNDVRVRNTVENRNDVRVRNTVENRNNVRNSLAQSQQQDVTVNNTVTGGGQGSGNNPRYQPVAPVYLGALPSGGIAGCGNEGVQASGGSGLFNFGFGISRAQDDCRAIGLYQVTEREETPEVRREILCTVSRFRNAARAGGRPCAADRPAPVEESTTQTPVQTTVVTTQERVRPAYCANLASRGVPPTAECL